MFTGIEPFSNSKFYYFILKHHNASNPVAPIFKVAADLNVAEIVACWILKGHTGDAQESIFGSRGCS